MNDGYVHVHGLLLPSVLHAIALLSCCAAIVTSAARATVRQLVALQTCVVAAVQQALHSLETQGCKAAHKMLLRTSLRSMARVRRASTAAAAAPRCVVELISDTM